ncbi:MAG: DUF2971 domain-containing protein [Opitutae bacterium]|nr:DUF2971 domain-containing protein [Opitutae bacterium]
MELKITPPNEFDDPIEFTPRLADSAREQAAVCRRIHRCGVSLSEATIAEAKLQLIAGAPKAAREIWSKYLVVLCLSEKPDIPTQWSLYADKHTGLALELDTAMPPFSAFRLPNPSGDRLFFRVRYCLPEEKMAQELFAAMEENENGNPDPFTRILFQSAAEKSRQWCLEQESRLVRPILNTDGELPAEIKRRLVNGKVMYFLQITAETISRVILGANASEEFEREVRKAAAHRGIAADRIIRARLDHQHLAAKIP